MPVDLTVRRTKVVREASFDTRGVKRELERLLQVLGRERDELSLVIADDAFIQPLNREWRGVDAPTDVLSFPQEDLAPVADEIGRASEEVDGPPRVLGDLVISVETAARQAAELGHDVMTELVVLAVHGTLHLLGHEHEEDDVASARMSAAEERLLQALDVDVRAALIARVR